MKTTNTIEINGKIYDARSGALIKNLKPTKTSAKTSQPAKTSVAKTTVATAKPKSAGRFIDGVKVTGKANAAAVKNRPQTQAKPKPTKTHSKAPNMKNRAQKSRTLNRKAVTVPKIEASKDTLPSTIGTKTNTNKRLERAMMTSKSSVVSRFPSRKNQPSVTPAEIKKPAANAPSSKPRTSTLSVSTNEPIVKVKAKSKRKHKIKKHASFVGFGLVILASIAIVIYIAYLNVPAFSMKVAASRAGFPASLPSYTPDGYKISGPVKYGSSIVTINYGSNNDGKTFDLTEQPTNWDTNALKENYVDQQSKYEPITQQYNGLTIYLFEGKAAWINGGNLYVLNTNGSQLAVDQILKLAASV